MLQPERVKIVSRGIKLTSRQESLILAMQERRIRVHYMPYMGRFNQNDYYFRSDTMEHVTQAAERLKTLGLAVMEGRYSHEKLVLTEAGRAWKSPAVPNP